jgi:uncharacterized protein (DUF2147 family)
MIVLAWAAMACQAAAAEMIDGVWRSPEGRRGSYLHVRVQPCGENTTARCGIVTGTFDGAKRQALGQQVMRDMQRQPDGTWQGTVIVPLKGVVYYSRIRPAGDGTMDIEGCMLGMLLCRKQKWTRVN